MVTLVIIYFNIFQAILGLFGFNNNDIPTNAHLHQHPHTCTHDKVPNLAEASDFTPVGDTIIWSSDKKLTFDDFKAIPDYSTDYVVANTYSGIRFGYYCEDGELKHRVQAMYIKSQSWIKPVAQNDYYLEHEQLHFDITELYARKLHHALNKYNFDCSQTADIQMIADKILAEHRYADHQYDKETEFSNNKYKQSNWYVKVHTELNEYACLPNL